MFYEFYEFNFCCDMYSIYYICIYVFSDATEISVPFWQNRESTPEEEEAAVKLQAIWRGTYVRLLMNSRKPGQDSPN